MSKIKEVREFLIKEGFKTEDNRLYTDSFASVRLESNQIIFNNPLLRINFFKPTKLNKLYDFIINREKIFEGHTKSFLMINKLFFAHNITSCLYQNHIIKNNSENNFEKINELNSIIKGIINNE